LKKKIVKQPLHLIGKLLLPTLFIKVEQV